MTDPDGAEEPFGWVHEKSFRWHLAEVIGSCIGWIAWVHARLGRFARAEALADHAIRLRREGRGAIRAIGRHAAARGRLAGRRGQLLLHGRMGPRGPFADLYFYATYDVAAFNEERALALIRRFEPDAVPDSLAIEEGALDHDDPGAEGVLWIRPGKSFYREDDAG